MKRPALYITIFFCLGILSCRFFGGPCAYYCLLLAVVFILASILSSRRHLSAHVAIYIATLFLGMAYYQNSIVLPADDISNFATGKAAKVIVKGLIIDDPVAATTFYKKDKISFVLQAAHIKTGSEWQKVAGLVRVDVYSEKKEDIFFGDEVVLEGLIYRPAGLRNPGLFDYSKYLEMRNIRALLKVKDRSSVEVVGTRPANLVQRLAYKVRHRIRGLFDKYMDKQYGGFLKAIIIGDRNDLANSIKDDFVKTGTVHVVAISGLNVGLIAALILFIFGMLRIPRKMNLALTVALLVFYSYMVGSGPPIVRSVIVFSIFAIGYIMNREPDNLNSLSVAAFLILLWNPKELFDPSFQLSFVSVASIIIFMPHIDRLFGLDKFTGRSSREKFARYILKGVSVSVAAWAGTWPIIAYYFNIISPVAVIANLIAIPMLFILTCAASLFLAFGLVMPALASLVTPVLYLIEWALFMSNKILAQIPLAFFRVAAPSLETSLLYYGLIALPLLPASMELKKFRITRGEVLILVMLFLNISVWSALVGGMKNKDELKITVLDVGQGDSMFVEFPDRGNLLIDGGSGGQEEKFDVGKSVVAVYLWNKGITRIDAVAVTHFHEDHLGGIIYILKNFKVGCVIDNGALPATDNPIYREYIKTIRAKRIRRIVVGEGDMLDPSNGVKILILNPEKREHISDSNENSVVMKLVYGKFAMLFCADAQGLALKRMSSYDGLLRSDVAKIPHHGGRLGDNTAVKYFLETVSPKDAVISVARMNRYGAPSEITLDILTSLGIKTYTTKDDGALTVSTDSHTYKIRGYAGGNN